jgi:hypothetical protein
MVSAEMYWLNRSPAIWVVELEVGPPYAVKRDTRLVRARDAAGAIRTAEFHTHLKGKPTATARLAHPFDDLGAAPV